MPAWKSLFLHEFADDNLASCNCVEGGLESFPPQGFVIADPAAQPTRFFAVIKRAKWLRFTPRKVPKDIIGADITVELSINLANTDDVSFPVVQLRDSLSLSVRLDSPFSAPTLVDGIPTDIVTLLLSLGGSEFRFERLLVKKDQFVRIRLSWHTNGQARLHVDGKLVAFANNFSASARFDATSLEVGDTDNVNLSTTIHVAPWFKIRHLDVKLLREDDHSDPISDLFPEITVGQSSVRCVQFAQERQEQILSRLRSFMSGVSRKVTTNWEQGAAGEPFTSTAKAIHGTSEEVLRAFFAFVDEPGNQAAQEFLVPFSQLLVMLKAVSPTEFQQLREEVNGLPPLNAACLQKASELREAHKPRVEPVLRLLEQANAIISNT